MARKNLRTLKRGDTVTLQEDGSAHIFNGFTGNSGQYGSDGPVYPDWKSLAEARGLRTFADLDKLDAPAGYGFTHYAEFQDIREGYIWHAYRFNGRWVLGSSADPLRIK